MPPKKKKQKVAAGPSPEELERAEKLRQSVSLALEQSGEEQLNGVKDTTEWLVKTWEGQKFAKSGGNEEVLAATTASLLPFAKEALERKQQILMALEGRLMAGERTKLNEKWIPLPSMETNTTPGDANHICCKIQMHVGLPVGH